MELVQVLTDWTGCPSPDSKMTNITGTPLFAAVSVLQNGPHSISSMLEGLYYSMLHVCRGGSLPDEAKHGRPGSWACYRRGMFMDNVPMSAFDVADQFVPSSWSCMGSFGRGLTRTAASTSSPSVWKPSKRCAASTSQRPDIPDRTPREYSLA